MYSIRITEDFLYNHYNKVSAKIHNKTIFGGKHNVMESTGSHFEIWLMRSLFCELKTDSKVFRLREGDILIFSNSDKKNLFQTDQNAAFLILEIDPTAFLEMLPKCEISSSASFFHAHSHKFENKLNAFSPAAKKITDQLINAEKSFSKKLFAYELDVLGCIINIISIILNDTDYYRPEQEHLGNKKKSKHHRSLKNVLDYIDTHLNEELTLDKLAEVSGLSPNYLSNIFRSQTGVKLWDYICEKRIILASQLLLDNPSDSILSIALKCGYNNCPNFNRAFKKYTGQTPKQYKILTLRQEVQNEK